MNDDGTAIDGFHIVPFAPDGEFLGSGYCHCAQLSSNWIDICTSFLKSQDSSFRASWGQELHRIETRLTSVEGAALGTFYVDGIPALSTLYLRGSNADSECEVMTMFTDSMRRATSAMNSAASENGFDSIHEIMDRPLVAVVVWPHEKITDDDEELIRELSTHFAAAYFKQ